MQGLRLFGRGGFGGVVLWWRWGRRRAWLGLGLGLRCGWMAVAVVGVRLVPGLWMGWRLGRFRIGMRRWRSGGGLRLSRRGCVLVRSLSM